MKRSGFLLLLVFAFFSGCNKDGSIDYCYSNSLLSQVNSGDQAVHGLTYNSNCLVYESTEPFTYKKYTYDSGNLLSKIELAHSFDAFSCVMIPGQSLESDPRNAEISEYWEFNYDDSSRITKKSIYYVNSGSPQFLSYETYEYSQNRIIKLSTYNPQGRLTGYSDYAYDETGNVIREDQYMLSPSLEQVKTSSYEFDDKNNPFRMQACEGTPGIFTNINNITTEITTRYYTSGEHQFTTQNVYEYNSLDLPVKVNGLVYKYGK